MFISILTRIWGELINIEAVYAATNYFQGHNFLTTLEVDTSDMTNLARKFIPLRSEENAFCTAIIRNRRPDRLYPFQYVVSQVTKRVVKWRLTFTKASIDNRDYVSIRRYYEIGFIFLTDLTTWGGKVRVGNRYTENSSSNFAVFSCLDIISAHSCDIFHQCPSLPRIITKFILG